jgi:hypothetical protein
LVVILLLLWRGIIVIDSWLCRECGVKIEALDSETLHWGIETHRCVEPLAEMMVDERMGRFDRLMVMWLINAYGRPFWLYRPGGRGVLVT